MAGDEAFDRATLKGLKSVGITLDAVPEDLAKEGVTEEALRSRVAQRLQQAGIPIDAASKEFVGLRFVAVREAKGPYAVAITIAFYQPVTLVRDTSIRRAPDTWDVETIFLADPKMVHRATTESVDDLADRFIAAWRSVNP